MIQETVTTTEFTTRPYEVLISLGLVSNYALTLNLIMDNRDFVEGSQITAIIELVRELKGWRTSPDISINDSTRIIELDY